MLKKILCVLLYALPVVFFAVCYFLIVTSGEDIFQGANTSPDIFGDMAAAFNHSARLADMYAWAVINFFDYVYKFGVDTIFRIIDVLAALFLLWLSTYIALGRRPRLVLKDAIIYGAVFLALMLTSSGVTLYGGFSKIHNYLFIGVVCTAFGLVYFKDLLCGMKLGAKITRAKKIWLAVLMLIFGYVFGLTSSVTAVAFLISLPLFALYLRISHQKICMRDFVLSWRGASVVGVLFSLFCIYVIGPGLAEYGTSEIYKTACDYLAFDEIFADFFGSVWRIVQHNAFNFGRFLAPFAVVLAGMVVVYLVTGRRAKNKRWLKGFSRDQRNFLVAALLFVFMHIFALSQIYYFTRMVLPAYLVAVAVGLYVARFWFDATFRGKSGVTALATVMVGAMVTLVVVRGCFAAEYLGKAGRVLEEIRAFDGEVYCVKLADVKSRNLPYIYLGQEDFLVDWAMPQTVYGKTVAECDM